VNNPKTITLKECSTNGGLNVNWVWIRQLILEKAKILEKVSTENEFTFDISKCVLKLDIIKKAAMYRKRSGEYHNVYYRLHKEEQKEISRDPKSEKAYCFIASNTASPYVSHHVSNESSRNNSNESSRNTSDDEEYY
jgi:hypothetical protein